MSPRSHQHSPAERRGWWWMIPSDGIVSMRVLCTVCHRPLALFLYSGVGECLPVAVLAVPVEACELKRRH